MNNNIELYKKLYNNNKFEEIIEKIETLEEVKSSQILYILGICKLKKKILHKKIEYLQEKILGKFS